MRHRFIHDAASNHMQVKTVNKNLGFHLWAYGIGLGLDLQMVLKF
jgi:hypothetical protein